MITIVYLWSLFYGWKVSTVEEGVTFGFNYWSTTLETEWFICMVWLHCESIFFWVSNWIEVTGLLFMWDVTQSGVGVHMLGKKVKIRAVWCNNANLPSISIESNPWSRPIQTIIHRLLLPSDRLILTLIHPRHIIIDFLKHLQLFPFTYLVIISIM